jgi:serine-aspartate repeat-containing protein C/D/E
MIRQQIEISREESRKSVMAQNDRSNANIEPLEGRTLLASSISGIVFNDANADGLREVGEKGLNKQTVVIDLNVNGRIDPGEPISVTNARGEYSFTGLNAGIYRVGLVGSAGMRQTSPASNFYDISANGLDIHAANDFGLTTTGIVRGTVFNDTNRNGVKDLIEQGVSGITVFIDKNNNGKLDKNEKSRLSDASGAYRFRGLTPGTYVIRISLPAGVSVTAPATGLYRVKLKSAQSLSNRNFGLA